jgi:hypothetical protein
MTDLPTGAGYVGRSPALYSWSAAFEKSETG